MHSVSQYFPIFLWLENALDQSKYSECWMTNVNLFQYCPTYSDWCPGCDLDLQRRRSKSETIDFQYRKRSRDMKTPSPNRKENKEYLDVRDYRLESSTVQTNLCELPTTYINNCQTTVPLSGASYATEFANFVDPLYNKHDKSRRSFTNEKSYHKSSRHSPRNNSDILNNISGSNKLNKSPAKTDCFENDVKCSLFKYSELLDGQILSRNYKSNNFPIRSKTSPKMEHGSSSKYETHILKNSAGCGDNNIQRQVSKTSTYDLPIKHLNYTKHLGEPSLGYPAFDLNSESNTTFASNYNTHTAKHSLFAAPFEVPKAHAIAKQTKDVYLVEAKKEVRLKSAVKLASIKNRHKLSAIKLKKVRSKIAHSVSSDSNLSDSDYSFSDDELIEEIFESAGDAVTINSHEVINGSTPVNGNSVSVTNDFEEANKWPVRQSLFAHIPPYITFVAHDTVSYHPPQELARALKWRLSTTTPIVVRKVLTNTGFKLVRKSNDWMGTWGKHMKSICFQSLKESQKLNHFPGTFQIGRKDRLWKNLQRLMQKYGQKEFGFIPRTFVLPQDLKLLRHSWEKSGHDKWIIKPPASARGTGIRVIHRWAHLPKKKSLVVQQYISNPYLINGSKFDLRLYVLVTNFNPLRIYLYPDGLARFASTKYSDDVSTLSDRYMHLTNYSINKLSSHYTTNEDANACKGHKWTLSKLWEYLEKNGVNTKNLWRTLQQLVIKTMLCAESSINLLYKANVNSRYNCYELFGVDVLLDEKFKPWLLEVNISPSLHSASPLDLHVKGPLVQSILNLAQFHLPSKLKRFRKAPPCLNSDLYTTQLTTKERLKHMAYAECDSRDEYLAGILRDLTGDDIRHLAQAEDELTVIGNFERIFPTQHTHYYFQFMEVRYYNRLFDAWETNYEVDRSAGIKLLQALCEKKIHLIVPPSPVAKIIAADSDQTSAEVSLSEDSVAIVAPNQKKPQTPRATKSQTPRTTIPQTPRSTVPQTPRTTIPQTPRCITPQTPRTTILQSHRTARPQTPCITRPQTPCIARPQTPCSTNRSNSGAK